MHQHARVSIAGYHAGVACIALVGDALQIKDRAEGLLPCFAAPDAEIPIQVEILASSHARYRLRFPPDVTTNLAQEGSRVHNGEAALEPIDGGYCIEQFVAVEINQVRVAVVYQRGGPQWCATRIGEPDRLEAQPLQRVRQLLVIDETVHRNRRIDRDAKLLGPRDAFRHPLAQPVEPPVALVLCQPITVDGYDQP